jgi:UDP-3-O-[3-hydroxymyristoyl] glucosamine N-acyltransferase
LTGDESPGALSEPRTLAALAADHGGTLDEGVGARSVRRIAMPEASRSAEDLVLVLRRAGAELARNVSGVVLCAPEAASRLAPGARWVHPHALWVVARLLLGSPERRPGIASTAVVAAGAQIDPSAEIRAGAVVQDGVLVGPGSTIGEGAVLYGGTRLGARVVVGPNAVIGRPGFGWAEGPGGERLRVPQLGGVVVEDDVEIGALATVDAGTLGPTTIRRFAKLDAHVHVGHNVVVGEATLVAAQAGFAGSSRIGRGVLVGGQVGVTDHAEIGDGARLAAKSGVISDVPTGSTVAGYPAVPRLRWLRAWATLFGASRLRASGSGKTKKR